MKKHLPFLTFGSTFLLLASFAFGQRIAITQTPKKADSVKLMAIESTIATPFNRAKEDEGEWIHWDDGTNYTGIGYNGPGEFAVASRWEAADLADYDGLYITQISFFPREANATYSLKIWTGVNHSSAYTQDVEEVTIMEWNTVELETPYQIDASAEMMFGYYIITEAGYPAGADAGPAVGGKGDMLYDVDDGWVAMAADYGLNYNWNIQAYVEALETSSVTFNVDMSEAEGFDPDEDIVYLTGSMVGWAEPGTEGSIEMELVSSSKDAPYTWEESWEEYADFTTTLTPWITHLINDDVTWGSSDFDFPGEGESFAFMVFNPAETDPDISDNHPAYEGSKYLIAVQSQTINDNKWLISPATSINETSEFSFAAKSITAAYGLERFRVLVSTTGTATGDFTQISEGNYLETPTNWQVYAFDLSDYAGEVVHIAIQYVSYDAFIFMLDDFKVTAEVEPPTELIYTATLQLETGTYEYKYFLNAGWANGEWDGDPNRIVNVQGNMVINDVWGVYDDELTLCEALDNCDLTFTTGGNAPWFPQTVVTHDGIDAAQSGTITHSQNSWLQTTVQGPGDLSFWWKVSSESCCDYLEFYINGNYQTYIAGEIGWQLKEYYLQEGSNTLRWVYTKDGSVNTGSDCGWLDQVVFIGENIGFPVVTTSAVTSITATTAVSGGNVTSQGDSPVTARGVVWSTYANPTLENNMGYTVNGTGTGAFTSNMSDLTPGTVYYVRAYATNSFGTAYGQSISFSTLCAPFSIPFSENFDYVTPPYLPNCWNQIQIGETYLETFSGYYYSYPNMVYAYVDNFESEVYLILPEIDQNLNGLRLEFMARNYYGNDMVLEIGTMSDPANAASFNYLNHVVVPYSYENFVYYFTNYYGNDRFIAFRLSSNVVDQTGYVFIDDVVVDDYVPSIYSLTLLANPTYGGTVSGAGDYYDGESVTITATPYGGYAFVSWTYQGEVISYSPSFTFNMPPQDITLTANFIDATEYMVTVNVKDIYNNPIPDAEVEVYDFTYEEWYEESTNGGGQAIFYLLNGEYYYSISKSGYNTSDGYFTVDGGGLTLNITLEEYVYIPSPYGLTAYLDEETGQVELDWNYSSGEGFYEDFSDGVADNWNFSDGRFSVQDGCLMMNGISNDTPASTYFNETYSNFAYEFEVTRHLSENTLNYSMYAIVRSNGFIDESTNGYTFNFTANGFFSVWKYEDGSISNIIPWSNSEYINPGLESSNIYTIYAYGPEFYFYANGNYLASFEDYTYAEGFVGLGLYDSYNGSNLVTWDYAMLSPDLKLQPYSAELLGRLHLKPKHQPSLKDEPYTDGSTPVSGSLIPKPTIPAKGVAKFYTTDKSKAFQHFNVYRNYSLLSTASENWYYDQLPGDGQYTYYVTAQHDEGESNSSNTVTVTWGDVLYNLTMLVVDQDENPIQNAWTMVCNDYEECWEANTNTSGLVQHQLPADYYYYQVYKEGYMTSEGWFYLNSDNQLTVTLYEEFTGPGSSCNEAVYYGAIDGHVEYGTTTPYAPYFWYSFILPTTFYNVSVSTCYYSDFDTQLEVWASCYDESWIAHNDDYCGAQSQINFDVLAAGTYYVKVYGYSNYTGNYGLHITGSNQAPTFSVTLQANPDYIGATLYGAGSYPQFSSVYISAGYVTGYTFTEWSGTSEDMALLVNPYSMSTSFSMPGRSVSYTANYEPNEYDVTVEIYPENAGTVYGEGSYYMGNWVTLSAYPNTGYEFLNWRINGSVVSSSNPYSFQMPSNNINIMAYFKEQGVASYAITLLADPDDIDAVLVGSGEYIAGEEAVISALPVVGYTFAGWTGSAEDVALLSNASAMTTSLTMPSRAITLTANYEVQTAFTVTFYVLSKNNNPVAGAVINIVGASSISTNANGIASTILENGSYSFSINATGYGAYSSNFTVSGSNRNIIVTLTPVGVDIGVLSSLEVFPNPFSSSITLNNASGVSRLIVTNIIGQQVMDMQLSGSERITIPTDGLTRGIYLMVFEAENGERVIRRMVKE